jgi:glycerate kinase
VSLNVLIAPDKFKGTLSAGAAAAAIARGWRQVRPQDTLVLLPITDGGDGFGEVVGRSLGGIRQSVRTIDAAHQACRARWWHADSIRTAVIESAEVIGLARLKRDRFHPFELDTFGLGSVLRTAADRGVKRCLVGIGGSATNDGGFGLARALGWQFLDRPGRSLARWTELDGLHDLRPPPGTLGFTQLLVAVDVQNPLLGPRGATRVYGPQKGLRPADFRHAECCLRRLAKVMTDRFGRRFERQPGSGAAGGLGFGLLAFAGGKLVPGFDLFARQADLARCLRGADLVLTGEGALDDSTFMGKGVGQIARQCRQLGIRCIGLGGAVALSAAQQRWFARTFALTQVTNVERAKVEAARWLAELAAMAGRGLEAAGPGHQ